MLDNAGMAMASLYLLPMPLIGAAAKRTSREATLKGFYLAGSSLGVASLFFSRYATQYSGDSLLGVPGEAYRKGFSALAVVVAVMGIAIVQRFLSPSRVVATDK